MNIDETLSYIHAVCWRSSIPGLERIRALLALMGDPQKDLKFIHVTGTNGKGSTCAMMASILRAAGYRTGLYTSPFLIRFNERMQVDGQQITDDELCEITAQVRPLADSLDPHPTEFEMVTAIAFAYFARHNCDIVVCEVGMGGEFDATNVIPAPEAAVFCNIGLDHTQYLGDTIEKITATKAGIIKPGCDAVLYRQTASAEEIIRQRCAGLGVPLHLADFDGIRLEKAGLEGQVFDWEELTSGCFRPGAGPLPMPTSAGGWPPPTGPAGSRSSAWTRCSSSTAATIPSASRPWSRTSGTICPVGP